MKRTAFLLGAASGLAVVGHADGFFARALAQTPLAATAGGADRVLVLVNFHGGNDGLNSVVPYGIAGLLQVPALAGRSGERRAAHRRHGRPQSEAQSVQGPVRQGQGRDRTGRRLSQPRPLALPLDRDLADRRAATRTSRPDGSAAISTAPDCRRPISSTRSRSPTCCPKRWSPIASTCRRSPQLKATA